MITCKAFRNANIANNGANWLRGVLIYVKFSGGVNGGMSLFELRITHDFHTFALLKTGRSGGMVILPCNPLIINGFAKGRLLACKRRPFSVRFAAFCTMKRGILPGNCPRRTFHFFTFTTTFTGCTQPRYWLSASATAASQMTSERPGLSHPASYSTKRNVRSPTLRTGPLTTSM